jgi:hypothetical protein
MAPGARGLLSLGEVNEVSGERFCAYYLCGVSVLCCGREPIFE